MPNKRLDLFKSRHLQSLLLHLGASNTGTKPVLLQRLKVALDTPNIRRTPQSTGLDPGKLRQPGLLRKDIAHKLPARSTDSGTLPQKTVSDQTRSARILSVDMGIRNLAYCVVDIALPPSPPEDQHGDNNSINSTSTSGSERDAALNNNQTLGKRGSKPQINPSTLINTDASISPPSSPNPHLPTLHIHHWTVLSLLPTPVSTASADSSSSPSSSLSSPVSPTPTDLFHPSHLSHVAFALVSETWLPYNPSTILIERQRFRSMGGPTVQEWTLRVNILEAMIWAVLRALDRTRAVKSDGCCRNDGGSDGAKTGGLRSGSAGGRRNTSLSGNGGQRGSAAADALFTEALIPDALFRGAGGASVPDSIFPDVHSVSPARVAGFWGGIWLRQKKRRLARGGTLARSGGSSDVEDTSTGLVSGRFASLTEAGDVLSAGASDVEDTRTSSPPPPPSSSAASPQPRRQRQKFEKKEHVALVLSWLRSAVQDVEGGGIDSGSSSGSSTPLPINLTFSPSALHTAQSILNPKRRSDRTKRDVGTAETGIGVGVGEDTGMADSQSPKKMDDLADCLLQAAAWTVWEANRVTLNGCVTDVEREVLEENWRNVTELGLGSAGVEGEIVKRKRRRTGRKNATGG